MKLSKNFTRAEIEHSNTAKRLGISNEMSEEHLENMQHLIDRLIQPLRDSIGPIRVSSGYRSKALNRAIGGSLKSQHSKGQALDLQFWQNGKMMNELVYDWILDSNIEFDQMINEFDFSWIHISLKKKSNRKQILEAYKDEDGDTKYKYAEI
jgi:4-hydroxy-3-methylbut-2-en-1-yl diphosphate synthase IspG/GcpE